jgi:hypothetical protein
VHALAHTACKNNPNNSHNRTESATCAAAEQVVRPCSYARESALCPWVAPRGLGRHLAPRVVLEDAQNACARAREPSLVLTVVRRGVGQLSSAQRRCAHAGHAVPGMSPSNRRSAWCTAGSANAESKPARSPKSPTQKRRRCSSLPPLPCDTGDPICGQSSTTALARGLRDEAVRDYPTAASAPVIMTSGITDGGIGTK